MRVELLYLDGCPNWTLADKRLAEALKASGRANHRGVPTPGRDGRTG